MTLLLLALLTAGWIALPFVPAMLELWRPTDTAPLRVLGSFEGDTRHFARGLRAYLDRHLPLLVAREPTRAVVDGAFPDGTSVLLLRDAGMPAALHGPALHEEERRERRVHRLIVSRGPLLVPRGLAALAEIYAGGSVYGGTGAVYRAVLGEQDVRLATRSTVLRWVHAERDLVIEDDSLLYGRVSAEQLLVVGVGCRFERMHARRIDFGSAVAAVGAPPARERTPFRPASALEGPEGRTLVRGDLVVPRWSVVQGDLVATGRVRVGEGSIVHGSVKGHGAVLVDAGSVVHGSVVSALDLVISPGCAIDGPLIAERRCLVGHGARVGTADRPTTITAPVIEVEAGAVAYGTVWARELGIVRRPL